VGYKTLPIEMCAPGTWPRGPFAATTSDADEGQVAADAAATIGRLAAALSNRRKAYGWSRAMLARQSGVGQHTIGRIETGRSWPDLVTVARLARTLGLSITMAGGAGGTPDVVSSPASGAAGASAGPLRLGSAVTPAQVIEALFARDQRLAAEVTTLRRNRLQNAHAAGPGTPR